MSNKAKTGKTGKAGGTAATTKIATTYPIRRIPFVPNAVRNMPFTIHPVKK